MTRSHPAQASAPAIRPWSALERALLIRGATSLVVSERTDAISIRFAVDDRLVHLEVPTREGRPVDWDGLQSLLASKLDVVRVGRSTLSREFPTARSGGLRATRRPGLLKVTAALVVVALAVPLLALGGLGRSAVTFVTRPFTDTPAPRKDQAEQRPDALVVEPPARRESRGVRAGAGAAPGVEARPKERRTQPMIRRRGAEAATLEAPVPFDDADEPAPAIPETIAEETPTAEAAGGASPTPVAAAPDHDKDSKQQSSEPEPQRDTQGSGKPNGQSGGGGKGQGEGQDQGQGHGDAEPPGGPPADPGQPGKPDGGNPHGEPPGNGNPNGGGGEQGPGGPPTGEGSGPGANGNGGNGKGGGGKGVQSVDEEEA